MGLARHFSTRTALRIVSVCLLVGSCLALYDDESGRGFYIFGFGRGTSTVELRAINVETGESLWTNTGTYTLLDLNATALVVRTLLPGALNPSGFVLEGFGPQIATLDASTGEQLDIQPLSDSNELPIGGPPILLASREVFAVLKGDELNEFESETISVPSGKTFPIVFNSQELTKSGTIGLASASPVDNVVYYAPGNFVTVTDLMVRYDASGNKEAEFIPVGVEGRARRVFPPPEEPENVYVIGEANVAGRGEDSAVQFADFSVTKATKDLKTELWTWTSAFKQNGAEIYIPDIFSTIVVEEHLLFVMRQGGEVLAGLVEVTNPDGTTVSVQDPGNLSMILMYIDSSTGLVSRMSVKLPSDGPEGGFYQVQGAYYRPSSSKLILDGSFDGVAFSDVDISDDLAALGYCE